MGMSKRSPGELLLPRGDGKRRRPLPSSLPRGARPDGRVASAEPPPADREELEDGTDGVAGDAHRGALTALPLDRELDDAVAQLSRQEEKLAVEAESVEAQRGEESVGDRAATDLERGRAYRYTGARARDASAGFPLD